MDSTPVPINELPAREPGYRMTWDIAHGALAEQLAHLLTHSCRANHEAAGTAGDPHWKCGVCGSREEVDAGQGHGHSFSAWAVEICTTGLRKQGIEP